MGKQKTVAVVGAGPGGLAAAMILAHRGFKVKVFEKAPVIGGRSSELRLGPYRFDLGPTFLMMKYLLDELFEDVGLRSGDLLDFRRLDPMYELHFGRGVLKVTGDRKKMKEQIEKIFPGESAGLDMFYTQEAKRFAKLYPCLQKDYGKLQAFASSTLLRAFPQLAAGQSLYDVLARYFKSEELRLAFTFQSKYLGMSPWDCPGLFAMIPYTEHAHGVYHVMGGLSQISHAFARAAQNFGAEIFCDRPVRQVLVEKGRAFGLEMADGERVLCDDVVVNADFGYAVENLFPATALKRWTPKNLARKKYSCSTFMIYLGLDCTFPAAHHAIYFAKDYRQNLLDISKHLKLSEDFSVYVRNASVLDSTLAPPGHSALYILAPVPNATADVDWVVEGPLFREKILNFLATRPGFENIRAHIREEKVITPYDWEHDQNIYRGATFNMGHSLTQLLYMRPHNEFEDFANCYLVGGGTHPGSGLPTIFESARISSNLLSKKYAVDFVPPRPFDAESLCEQR